MRSYSICEAISAKCRGRGGFKLVKCVTGRRLYNNENLLHNGGLNGGVQSLPRKG